MGASNRDLIGRHEVLVTRNIETTMVHGVDQRPEKLMVAEVDVLFVPRLRSATNLANNSGSPPCPYKPPIIAKVG